MTVHVNDAGTWKTATPHVNDAGTWKEALEVWVNNAGTWQQVYASITVTVPAGSYSKTVTGGTSTCNISFATTRSWSCTNDSSSTGTWLSASGTPSNYEIRWTATSGTLSTGTAGTWQSLGGTITFGVTRSTVGTATAIGTVEIRRTSDSTVVASGSITLEAIRDV